MGDDFEDTFSGDLGDDFEDTFSDDLGDTFSDDLGDIFGDALGDALVGILYKLFLIACCRIFHLILTLSINILASKSFTKSAILAVRLYIESKYFFNNLYAIYLL